MPETDSEIASLIWDITDGVPDSRLLACVEAQVGVVGPGMRVSAPSMLTFGRNYGFCLGVLEAYGWNTRLVRPQKWQRALDLDGRGERTRGLWKGYLKAHAQRLNPHLRVTLATADALLILAYLIEEDGADVPF